MCNFQETQPPFNVLENKTVEAIDEAKRELKLELEKLHEAGTTVNQVSFLSIILAKTSQN